MSVVLRAFSTVFEARLAQSVLEAAGIETELRDENLVGAQWLYSNAVGGVKLLVPGPRVAEALSLLQTPAHAIDHDVLEDDSEEAYEQVEEACRVCGGTNFEAIVEGRRWAMLTWLLLGFPVARLRRLRRCTACGAALHQR
jgi:hypothetical protein